jgi:DNA-binding CsgD family transcriptional regulator
MSRNIILSDLEHLGLDEGSAVLLAAAIQQTNVAIAICDPDFRPYFLNPAARELLNVADFLPREQSESSPAPHVAELDTLAVHAAIERQGFWRESRSIPSGDGSGSPREADIEVSPFRDGEAAGLMIVAREVEPATSRNRLASDVYLITTSPHLTSREKEVMLGLLAGRSSKEMGKEMALSPRTIEFHRAKLMLRYGAKSLVELIQRVIHDEKPGPEEENSRPTK